MLARVAYQRTFAGGDQRAGYVTGGDLDEHRRFRGRIDIHARARRDGLAQLWIAGRCRALWRATASSAVSFGPSAFSRSQSDLMRLPGLGHLELRADLGIARVDIRR